MENQDYKINQVVWPSTFGCRRCQGEPQADVQNPLKNTEKSEAQENHRVKLQLWEGDRNLKPVQKDLCLTRPQVPTRLVRSLRGSIFRFRFSKILVDTNL